MQVTFHALVIQFVLFHQTKRFVRNVYLWWECKITAKNQQICMKRQQKNQCYVLMYNFVLNEHNVIDKSTKQIFCYITPTFH